MALAVEGMGCPPERSHRVTMLFGKKRAHGGSPIGAPCDIGARH
jgi:hypothetical protein